jgi:hypothetical protein
MEALSADQPVDEEDVEMVPRRRVYSYSIGG